MPAETAQWVTLCYGGSGFCQRCILGFHTRGCSKAKLNINEIITTLMLTYIAFQWNNYFVYGPWSERGFGLTPQFPKPAWMPRFADYAEAFQPSVVLLHIENFPRHCAGRPVLVYLEILQVGFEVKVIGDNPRAARYAGIDLARNIILIMMISGGMAGLAGMVEVAGVVHRLQGDFRPAMAIPPSSLPGWPSSILWQSCRCRTFWWLARRRRRHSAGGIARMLQGVILFVVVGGELLLQYRIRAERA